MDFCKSLVEFCSLSPQADPITIHESRSLYQSPTRERGYRLPCMTSHQDTSFIFATIA